MKAEKIFYVLKKKNVDFFLITNPKSIFYLTNFIGLDGANRESILLASHEKFILIVPAMYEKKARNIEKFDFLEIDILNQGKGFLETLKEIIEPKSKVMIEENDLKVSEFDLFKKELDSDLIKSENLISNLREIKEFKEIERIRKAVELTDKAFAWVEIFVNNGLNMKVSEGDVVDSLISVARDLESEGLGFDSIIASGSGSAEPHYISKSKIIDKNKPLLIDVGIKYKGYTGDLTRTILLGEVDEEVKVIYDIVLECNKICIDMCKPGIKFMDVHKRAIEFFKSKEMNGHNLEKYFIHSIGHGVGLDVHEGPYLKTQKEEPLLKNGNVITIEPGLYFGKDAVELGVVNSKFGIRIEDMVLITEDGCEVLSKSKK